MLVSLFAASSGRTSGRGDDEWNVDIYNAPILAPNPEAIGVKNDELSSVEIHVDGLILEIFSDSNYGGRSIKLDSKGFYDLRNYGMDDSASSFKFYLKGQYPVPITPAPINPIPQPSDKYVVQNLHFSNGNLYLTVINTRTGENITCYGNKTTEKNGFTLTLPDNTSFFIRSEWGVEVIHANAYFSSGAGGTLIDAGTLAFRSGQTVNFGVHNGAVSCTIWMKESTDQAPVTPVNPPVNPVNPPVDDTGDQKPVEPTNPPVDDTTSPKPVEPTNPVDGQGPVSPTPTIPPVKIELDGNLGGGGCNSSINAFSALVPVAFGLLRKKRK
jgi:hypothetical protein